MKEGLENYNLIPEQPEKKKSKEKLAPISEVIENILSNMDSNTAHEIFEFEKDFNRDNEEDLDLKDYLLGKILFSRSPEDLPETGETNSPFDTESGEIEAFIRSLAENNKELLTA